MSFVARAAFAVLVAATFAGIFVAQRLKSAPKVAVITRITHQFSPNGDGRRDSCAIRLRVRKDDDVTISIVDADDTPVRRLAAAVPARARQAVKVDWDGRADDGARVPEGSYRVRVSLRRGGRAVTLGPSVRLDTTAPHPTVFAGGADGSDWITGPVAGRVPFQIRVVSSHLPTRIRVLRTDHGPARAVSSFELPPNTRSGSWDGRAGAAPAPPGTYQIVATVRDLAGNAGSSAPPATAPVPVRGRPGVSVRALLARPPADPVSAGELVQFAVDSRGRPYRWRIYRVGDPEPVAKGRKRSGGQLELRAPGDRSGLYVLKLRTVKRSTAVPFEVQDDTLAPVLVVVPALTWFGSDSLDDDRDGLPNTLAAGRPAAYPRLLADGLPEGFGDQVAPLLEFLDSQKINYDITTDLTLAASEAGLSDERQGVLLAGPLRWISTGVARRLRRYAAGGGTLASFGADSMRRGVSVARDRLLRPLPPTGTDPFGTRIRDERRLTGAGAPLLPIADEGDTGLLTGVERLPGFAQLEESEPSERVHVALAAVDQAALDKAEAAGDELPPAYPAVALTQVGDGTVIRVGLPEWGAKLRAGTVPVQQLTRNIVDILRGAKPKIRSF